MAFVLFGINKCLPLNPGAHQVVGGGVLSEKNTAYSFIFELIQSGEHCAKEYKAGTSSNFVTGQY